MPIELASLTRAEEVEGATPSETMAIRNAVEAARQYLLGFEWCAGVVRTFVGVAVPPMVTVALHQIVPGKQGVDEWLWTVTGDLPPAYLVTDCVKSAEAAIEAYVGEMRAWVEAVKFQQPTEDLIPVNAPETPEYADMLEQRLAILERTLLDSE